MCFINLNKNFERFVIASFLMLVITDKLSSWLEQEEVERHGSKK